MIIGVWVILILYLGFPASWDRPLLIATGLILIVMGYRLKLAPKEPTAPVSAPTPDYKPDIKADPS